MKKRFKMNRNASRRSFSGAAAAHPKNLLSGPMRGGYRL